MNQPDYTPGPWHAIDQGEGPRGKSLGICISDSRRIPVFIVPRGNKRNLANARLIAAAPELLLVLKKCEDAMTRQDFGTISLLPDVRAVIAKAEGRS